MKVISIPFVLAGLFFPVAIVGAQPEGGDPEKKSPIEGEESGPKGGHHMRGFGKGWREADADHSGTLTLDEFNQLPRIQRIPEEKRTKIFNRLDKDQDGILNAEELKMMMRPPDEARREAMKRFRELDTDGSGGVSFEEFKAGELFKKLPPEKQKTLFDRLDTDGDGEITLRDRPPKPPHGRPGGSEGEGRSDDGNPKRPFKDPRRMLKEMDENQDGEVTFEEFRKSPRIRDLSEDEQEDRFEARDKNGDKKLTEADFPPPPAEKSPEAKEVPKQDSSPEGEKEKGD